MNISYIVAQYFHPQNKEIMFLPIPSFVFWGKVHMSFDKQGFIWAMSLRIKPSYSSEFYDQKDAYITTKLIRKSDCLKFMETIFPLIAGKNVRGLVLLQPPCNNEKRACMSNAPTWRDNSKTFFLNKFATFHISYELLQKEGCWYLAKYLLPEKT